MAIKALPITKKMKIIDIKEFTKVVLNENFKLFIIHIAILTSKITIHLTRKV